jgi:hypothetical protein
MPPPERYENREPLGAAPSGFLPTGYTIDALGERTGWAMMQSCGYFTSATPTPLPQTPVD